MLGMMGSLCCALTIGFGSIYFGSLLIALVQVVKAMVQRAIDQDNMIMVYIVKCILSCIKR